MFDRLPAELVIDIIREAAEYFTLRDRATARNLALTSTFVYDIVAPVLYRTMIITNRQLPTSSDGLLLHAAAAKRVCKQVERLFITSTFLGRAAYTQLLGLFTNVRSLAAFNGAMEIVLPVLAQHGTLRRVWFLSERNDSVEIPASVTHLTLFVDTSAALVRECKSFAKNEKHITHLAFEMYDGSFPVQHTTEGVVDALSHLLRDETMSPLQQIAFCVCEKANRWASSPLVEDALAESMVAVLQALPIADRAAAADKVRVKMIARDQGQGDVSQVEDEFREGRDVWTHCRPIIQYNMSG